MQTLELQAYIESGIIEYYVLGLATAEETAELLRMKKQHPELNQEIAAVEQRIQQVLNAESVRPPVAIKKRLLESLHEEEHAQPAPAGKHPR